jgi:subtilase family serine protease
MRLHLLAVAVLLSSFTFAQQPLQRRIVQPIDNASAVRLRGTLAPRARADLDRGPVAAAMPMQNMSIVFSRTAAQQAELDQLLAEQHDQASANYHKWLTPEEFGNRFGLAEEDIKYVAGWLITQGFTVNEIARSRTWISFSGNAAQVETAFQAPIHNFVVDGVTHYAPSTEAAVPSALSNVITTITGLNDFRPRPHSRARQVNPQLTSSISGNHFLVPGDFGTIYNLPDYVSGAFQSGNDGSGQTIGIVGQTSGTGTNVVSISTITSDVTTFRNLSNLPAGNLTPVPVGSPTQFSTSEAEEAALDIEWAGAVAPNAAITFAYSTNALTSSLQNLVNQGGAAIQVISISFGDCEAQAQTGNLISSVEPLLSQADAQGQSVFAAAGDNGATDCDGTAQNPVMTATQGLAVDYPSSSVYVTAMGGTEFTGDSTATVANGVAPATQYWNGSSNVNDTSATAFSYIPEIVWNDTATTSTNVGTGGGVSKQFSKPSWQANDGIPASVDNNMRDVPDVALAASPNHDGYIICSQGECQTGYRRNSDQTFTVIGGTSAAVPAFAGIAALANQKLGSRQGNLNPQIYSLAASASWAFNDITTGDNKMVCTVGTTNCTSSPIGYSAGAGYDLVTGWGSVDATALLDALNGTPNPHFALLPNSRNVAMTPGGSSLVAVLVTPKEGFTGSVALTCTPSSSLAGITCSYDNTNVTTPGSANLTIQTNSSQGAQSGTVTLQGTSGSNTDSVTINVSVVIPDFQMSVGNATETVNTGGSTTDTLSITSLKGFTGSVGLSCAGTSGLTCSLSPTSVTANTAAAVTSTLTVSASTSATTGSITITGTSGSITHTVPIPVTVNVVAPDFTLTIASPVVSIPSGVTITDNLTVASVGGFNSDVALTCSVASSLGTTTCTISPMTVTGGNGTALITLKGAVLSRDRGAPLPFRHRGLGEYATVVFALGMVFAAAPDRRLLNKRTLRNVLLGLLVLGVMFSVVSCGGGGGGGSSGSGPTPLNGNVTITGTSGSITHTTTINVSVQ